MEFKTETTRMEDIIISILCIFIGLVTIGFDVHIQLSHDGWYLPTIFTWFGIGSFIVSYAFGKKCLQNLEEG